MAGIQFGNVTPSGVYGRPSIESFLAVSGAGYEIPSAERLFRAPWGNLNTPLSSGAGAGETYGQSSVPESIWLTDALAALAEVDDEIAEENLPEIDDATKKEAGRLLRALAWHPWGPTVYPMQDAEIAIRGMDDSGAMRGPVRLVLPAGHARTIEAPELEDGGAGLEGAIGDGQGKWRLDIEADRDIQVMSLMESPEGHITNLSSLPDDN